MLHVAFKVTILLQETEFDLRANFTFLLLFNIYMYVNNKKWTVFNQRITERTSQTVFNLERLTMWRSMLLACDRMIPCKFFISYQIIDITKKNFLKIFAISTTISDFIFPIPTTIHFLFWFRLEFLFLWWHIKNGFSWSIIVLYN